MVNKKIRVLMAAAEVAPFAKVGGLADVTGSLPPALNKIGCEAKIIMPKYGSIDEKKYGLKKIKSNIRIKTDGHFKSVNLWKSKLPGTKTDVYFIENKNFFGKKEIYFGNNAERFLFFSLSVLESLPCLDFEPDIIHCHDFHTALITDLIKANPEKWGKLKTVYTIHNLNYQGKSEIELLSTGNLTKDSLKSLTRDSQDGDINFMVQGIINADGVNTVSKTYAKEIATSTYGAGLERVIKANKNKISGIVNGIDVDFFNPKKDKFIKYRFGTLTLGRKRKNKLNLQKKLGLEVSADIPMAGLISRLAWQKGLELMTEDSYKLDCQFVFLGTGDKKYENQLKKFAKKYPRKVSANMMFDVGLAQEIYAASDIFLMPSRFEPCGLGQMIAMRYGALPIVRSTGGLADTVDSAVGFKFTKFEAKAFEAALKKAIKTFSDKKKWNSMVKNAMKRDFSWKKSAGEYLKLYQKILRD
jgi:starch synthase